MSLPMPFRWSLVPGGTVNTVNTKSDPKKDALRKFRQSVANLGEVIIVFPQEGTHYSVQDDEEHHGGNH